MGLYSRGVLQAAATIAKTTQTVMGAEIKCGSYDYITLFWTYVKGDETGLDVQAHFTQSAGGTTHQEASWSATAGTKTSTVNEYRLTASNSVYAIFDIRGIEFVQFTQGGSNNDGTPTGTVAANFSMTAS